MRLNDALEAFLLQIHADGRSPHTVAQYRRHVRTFADFVGIDQDLSQITVGDLARFLTSPAALGASKPKRPTSVNALRTSLRVFFKHVHEASIAPTNPARLLRRARCTPPPPRGLSNDEVKRLSDVLVLAQGPSARRDHALIEVMLRTGLRLGSAFALDRSDVDLERGEILVRVAKNQAPERVFISAALRDHLVGYLAERDDGPLFTNRAGGRVGTRHVQRRIEQWLAKAGVRKGMSAHSMRHAFAMNLYRRTRDLPLVQHALKHRSIASTLIYAHAKDDELRQAIG